MSQIIDGNKFCSNCGADIDKRAVICPKCGVPQSGMMPQKSMKNEGLSAVLSFLVTGLGQVYNGQVAKGIFLFILCVIGLMLLIVPGIIVWIYGIWDAYNTATRINEGMSEI